MEKWWIGDPDKVRVLLQHELGIDAVDAEQLRRNLENMNQALQPIFLEWWKFGKMDPYAPIVKGGPLVRLETNN
jgi:hypothetical protein